MDKTNEADAVEMQRMLDKAKAKRLDAVVTFLQDDIRNTGRKMRDMQSSQDVYSSHMRQLAFIDVLKIAKGESDGHKE